MEHAFLIESIVLLSAAVLAVPLFRRLGLGAVLGYLAAGILIGPWLLGFIDEVDEIRHFAELGVVFLLFIIGIELKPSRLWLMRHWLLVVGTGQLMFTGLVLFALSSFFGLDSRTAVIVSFGMALSSTALGVQYLNERSELHSEAGRGAFSILLLQDLAVVPLALLITFLAEDSSLEEGLEFAALDTVLILIALLLFGRFLLNPALHLVAASRNKEVFTAAAILVVLGMALAMNAAGLSMALGAFLGGLSLAESPYRHQVVADIEPFRGLLLGLFFMAVGMSINFGVLWDDAVIVVALVVGLMVLKALIIAPLCKLRGMRWRNALRVAVLLSQSGEFGFVLFGMAATLGVLEGQLYTRLVLVIALSMLLTPLLVRLADRWLPFPRDRDDPMHFSHAALKGEVRQVIIAGFGRMGRRMAEILNTTDIDYMAVDNDSDVVQLARQDGFPVYFGDASRRDVLDAAGVDQSKLLVVTLNEPKASERLVRFFRQRHRDTPIFTRAVDREHARRLLKMGASRAISETLETSLQLVRDVLVAQDLEHARIQDLIQDYRGEYYRSLGECYQGQEDGDVTCPGAAHNAPTTVDGENPPVTGAAAQSPERDSGKSTESPQ